MARVKLNNVRISFPDLFQPKSFDGQQDAKYGAQFLIDKEGANYDAVIKAMKEVAAEKWPKSSDKALAKLTKEARTCLTDGDDKDYDGYQNMYCLSARSASRPLVIDKDKTKLDSADGKPYSGCYVNASIDIWAQDNKWGKRINAQLRGVQFWEDGEPFSGGSTASEDEFDAFPEDDEEEMF